MRGMKLTAFILAAVAAVVIACSLIAKASDDIDVARLGGLFTSLGMLIGTAALALYQIYRMVKRDRDRRVP
jgi:hypothetical protein